MAGGRGTIVVVVVCNKSWIGFGLVHLGIGEDRGRSVNGGGLFSLQRMEDTLLGVVALV